VLIDRIIGDAVANGADMVVNLAAGLDARPYRLTLPSQLQWIEVDLPDLLAYKTEQLAVKRRAASWSGWHSTCRTSLPVASCSNN
jgi:O-methyltransferase involved in polyketide biosynthesis